MIAETQDSRRHQRYHAEMPLVIAHATLKFLGHTEDVSQSGVCVLTDASVTVYSIINLTLPVPSEAPIELCGMVVHNGGPARDDGKRPLRIHLHFSDTYNAERWRNLIATIAWRTESKRLVPS